MNTRTSLHSELMGVEDVEPVLEAENYNPIQMRSEADSNQIEAGAGADKCKIKIENKAEVESEFNNEIPLLEQHIPFKTIEPEIKMKIRDENLVKSPPRLDLIKPKRRFYKLTSGVYRINGGSITSNMGKNPLHSSSSRSHENDKTITVDKDYLKSATSISNANTTWKLNSNNRTRVNQRVEKCGIIKTEEDYGTLLGKSDTLIYSCDVDMENCFETFTTKAELVLHRHLCSFRSRDQTNLVENPDQDARTRTGATHSRSVMLTGQSDKNVKEAIVTASPSNNLLTTSMPISVKCVKILPPQKFVSSNCITDVELKPTKKPSIKETRTYDCHLCDKKFFLQFLLDNHVKTHFNDREVEVINLNPRSFGDSNIPSDSSKPPTKNTLGLCVPLLETEDSDSKQPLALKQFKIPRSTDFYVVCTFCKVEFLTLEAYSSHLAMCNNNSKFSHDNNGYIKITYPCLSCCESFPSIKQQLEHFKEFHNMTIITTNCVSSKSKPISNNENVNSNGEKKLPKIIQNDEQSSRGPILNPEASSSKESHTHFHHHHRHHTSSGLSRTVTGKRPRSPAELEARKRNESLSRQELASNFLILKELLPSQSQKIFSKDYSKIKILNEAVLVIHNLKMAEQELIKTKKRLEVCKDMNINALYDLNLNIVNTQPRLHKET